MKGTKHTFETIFTAVAKSPNLPPKGKTACFCFYERFPFIEIELKRINKVKSSSTRACVNFYVLLSRASTFIYVYK